MIGMAIITYNSQFTLTLWRTLFHFFNLTCLGDAVNVFFAVLEPKKATLPNHIEYIRLA